MPNNYLGRVFAIDLALYSIIYSVSIWLSGYLLDAFMLRPQTLVLFFALIGLLPIAVWGIALRFFDREIG